MSAASAFSPTERRRRPDAVRNSRLYQNLVDATLRYLIEQVGGVEGVYRTDAALPDGQQDPGVLVADAGGDAASRFVQALVTRRHWQRESDPPRI